MTRLQAAATDPGRGAEPVGRLLIGLPSAALLALLCMIAISWTGWGFETDPAAQLLRDAPWVLLAGIAGAAAGAALAWSVIGRRGAAVAVGAGLGALPAAVRVTAYFTGAL